MNNIIENIKTENTGHIIGYVHSLQSMGAVDGPGIRFCVFLQGCPLRCMYCHNPDTWQIKSETNHSSSGVISVKTEYTQASPMHKTDDYTGDVPSNPAMSYTPEELVLKILRYKPYFANGGGVTVSGGEPLVQAEFVTELFTLLHEHGIHTCLDTSGNFPEGLRCDNGDGSLCHIEDVTKRTVPIVTSAVKYDRLLSVTDLVICDIKFTTETEYRKYTGGSLNKVLAFLDMVTRHSVPLWIRHVVVPGYTDSAEEVSAMVRIAKSYPTLQKIELLPFHKLCIPKYEALGIPFRCADIPECDGETIERLSKLL